MIHFENRKSNGSAFNALVVSDIQSFYSIELLKMCGHLALVGGDLCKKSLGDLGSLHLLLNFIINA